MISGKSPSHLDPYERRGSVNASRISIKRTEGLGRLLCLIPVADRLSASGVDVNIVTRPEWAEDLRILRPQFEWNGNSNEGHRVNFDALEEDRSSEEHRTDQYGRELGEEGPFEPLTLSIPASWREPFESFRGCIVFAPEAMAARRQWPNRLARHLAYHLPNKWIVLAGTDRSTEIVCDEDFRGRQRLGELMGLLSVAETVITMDSAVLYLSSALAVPTVAVFGGSHPCHGVRENQQVVVVQADLSCCPCNESHSCSKHYQCIGAAQPEDVVHAVHTVHGHQHRTIQKVRERSEASRKIA